MAAVHERLYASEQMNQIDFAGYAEALLHELLSSYVGSTGRIAGRVEGSQVFLEVDQAIPCGLILNELVSNALKYAFPQGESGEVVVEVSESAGLVRFAVCDSGVRLPEGFGWQSSNSMGLPIVELLVHQIAGKLSFLSTPGAAFTVEFPKQGGKSYAVEA